MLIKNNFYTKMLNSIFILLLGSSIYAAGPVTHIYLAERYFKLCKPEYTKEQRAAFKRGTLRPDVRKLARIPRTKTHVKDVQLKDILTTQDPFVAGQLFHSYVDEQRIIIIQKEKVNDALSLIPQKYLVNFLKVLEDELAYKKIDVNETLNAIKSGNSKEDRYGIPYPTVKAYNRDLLQYLKQSPLVLFNDRAKNGKSYQGFSAFQIAHLALAMTEFIKNKKITQYFETLESEFDKMLISGKKLDSQSPAK